MIEDNPEHVWVRVDPVIETLLGLEPGALTENPEVAPYPTRLAPEGTSWLVLIPPRVLEGRVWVGSEAAIDRLMVSRKRKRAQVSRYIRAGEYPRRLAPTGVTWQVGIPADTPLSPLEELQKAEDRIRQLHPVTGFQVSSVHSIPLIVAVLLARTRLPCHQGGSAFSQRSSRISEVPRGRAPPVMRWSSSPVHCGEPALSIPRRCQEDVREKTGVKSKVQKFTSKVQSSNQK